LAMSAGSLRLRFVRRALTINDPSLCSSMNTNSSSRLARTENTSMH
jgi:hypothetical protein